MEERLRLWAQFGGRLLALWLCVPIEIVVAGALPIDDDLRAFLFPAVLTSLAWPCMGVVSLLWSGKLFWKGRWLQAVLAFALPVYIVLCACSSREIIPLIGPALWCNDVLHLATMKRAYGSELNLLKPGQRLKVFIWHEDPVGGSGIVYDESDDIALAKTRRPRDWASGAEYQGVLQGLCSVYPMGSHYYHVFFGCG